VAGDCVYVRCAYIDIVCIYIYMDMALKALADGRGGGAQARRGGAGEALLL